MCKWFCGVKNFFKNCSVLGLNVREEKEGLPFSKVINKKKKKKQIRKRRRINFLLQKTVGICDVKE